MAVHVSTGTSTRVAGRERRAELGIAVRSSRSARFLGPARRAQGSFNPRLGGSSTTTARAAPCSLTHRVSFKAADSAVSILTSSSTLRPGDWYGLQVLHQIVRWWCGNRSAQARLVPAMTAPFGIVPAQTLENRLRALNTGLGEALVQLYCTWAQTDHPACHAGPA